MAAVAPDSLFVFDSGLRRATLFGPDREVVRTARFDVNLIRPHRFTVVEARFVGIVPRSMHREEEPRLGLHRLPVPVVTVSRSGQLLDTLTVVLGYESILQQVADDVLRYVDALFGRDAHLAVHGGKVIVGDATEMQYRVVRGDGSVERIVRAEYNVELTPEILEAERSACLGDDPTPEDLSFINSLPVSDTRAAYRDLKVDPTGAVWLKEDRGYCVNDTSLSPVAWEVFGPDGVWLGQVFLPGRFTVFEIGLDYVLGVFRDELDVERVQVLALHRQG